VPANKRATASKHASSLKPKASTKVQIATTSPSQTVSHPLREKTVRERALYLLSLPPNKADNTCGFVTVRFNHYCKKFPIHNGVLSWTHVDDEYSFSFVYRGQYRRDLFKLSASSSTATKAEDAVTRDCVGDFFVGLFDGDELKVEVEEDKEAGIGAEGLRIRDEKLSATALGQINSPGGLAKKSSQVADITKQLLAMNVDELHSEKAKELREARDVEDILFSST